MSLRPMLSCCLVLCMTPGTGTGTRSPAALCDDAARIAAQVSDIPLRVLLAITRVESGRTDGNAVQPWPWTINHAGIGNWFDSAAEAEVAAATALSEGNGNLDIGCFQLNHRWHGENFASLDQMFDPETNARYAANFLSDLYAEMGDWPGAIAAYHSRNAGPAASYLAKIETALADLGVQPEPVVSRENTYPLLQVGARGSGGSLVPRFAANRPLIGAVP